jgi:hypothetical protein
MPLPFILGAGAAVAALAGTAGGIYGAAAMKEANDTMKKTQERHQQNIASLEKNNIKTSTTMDRLGKRELEVLKSFKNFSDVFEKIHRFPKNKGSGIFGQRDGKLLTSSRIPNALNWLRNVRVWTGWRVGPSPRPS